MANFSNFLVNFPLKTNGNSPNSKQPVCWQLHKLLHHHVRQTGSFKILYSSPFAGYCFGGWTQTLGLRPWRGWTGGRGTRVCAWVRQRDSVGWLSNKLICYGRRMATGEILRGELEVAGAFGWWVPLCTRRLRVLAKPPVPMMCCGTKRRTISERGFAFNAEMTSDMRSYECSSWKYVNWVWCIEVQLETRRLQIVQFQWAPFFGRHFLSHFLGHSANPQNKFCFDGFEGGELLTCSTQVWHGNIHVFLKTHDMGWERFAPSLGGSGFKFDIWMLKEMLTPISCNLFQNHMPNHFGSF